MKLRSAIWFAFSAGVFGIVQKLWHLHTDSRYSPELGMTSRLSVFFFSQ
jgi:hypothetical protein